MDIEQRHRKDASKIYAVAKSQSEECSKKRRWIARNWPENTFLVTENSRTVPEDLVRLEDENQEVLLQLVETGLEKLRDDAEKETVDVEELSGMDDVEMLRALPGVIRSFKFTWVQSLYAAVTADTTNKCRDWAENELVRKVGVAFMAQNKDGLVPESLKPVAEKLRKLLAGEATKGRERFEVQGPSFLEGTPEDSCHEAVRFAISKLEELSIRCLHSMNDIILGKEFFIPSGKYGRSCKELARILRIKMSDLLESAEKEGELPEALQRVLRIMSLLSREQHGDDGGLSSHLDSLPEEFEALHSRILNAISQLYTLSFRELEQAYVKVANAEKRTAPTNHPRVYHESIRAVFQEVLYRCSSLDTVPKYVVEAVDMILGTKTPGIVCRKRKFAKQDVGQRTKQETKAMLNLSSELRARSWDFIESSALRFTEDDGYLKKQKLEEDADPSVQGSTFDFGDEDEVLDEVDREITAVADDGAALGYMLIGGLMDEFYKGSQNYASAYLQNGLLSEADEAMDKVKREPTQSLGPEADLLVEIAKRIPTISESVLRNAQRRFAKALEHTTTNLDENIAD